MKKSEKFLSFVQDKNNIKNILVFRNGLLGDTVFITSLLCRLNFTYPDANIDIIVGKTSIEVLKHFSGIRKIIPFNFNLSILSILKQIVFFISLIPNKYDLLIVPEVNPHYTIVGKFCFPKKIASFANPLGFSDYQIDRPKIKATLAEAELVKNWTQLDGKDKPVVFVSDEEKIKIRKHLESFSVSENDKILFFNPGSSTQYSEKDWAFENYAPVADHFINKHGYKVVFNGLKRDKQDFEKISSMMHSKAIMLGGENAVDIRSMFALISISDLVLGVDTGPIHIATALDIPVLCLTGFTDADETGPYNPNDLVTILKSDMPCIPCVHSNPKPAQWEICKSMRPVECMRRITPEKVILEIEKILNK
jgi:ADP-heptose:LPS heptosyltransferase